LDEYALRCVTRRSESANWGYQMARLYAERYDSRYRTGLIPASAAAVEEIAALWVRHLLRVHLGTLLSKVRLAPRHRGVSDARPSQGGPGHKAQPSQSMWCVQVTPARCGGFPRTHFLFLHVIFNIKDYIYRPVIATDQ
jgi:hypothetical protein